MTVAKLGHAMAITGLGILDGEEAKWDTTSVSSATSRSSRHIQQKNTSSVAVVKELEK